MPFDSIYLVEKENNGRNCWPGKSPSHLAGLCAPLKKGEAIFNSMYSVLGWLAMASVLVYALIISPFSALTTRSRVMLTRVPRIAHMGVARC